MPGGSSLRPTGRSRAGKGASLDDHGRGVSLSPSATTTNNIFGRMQAGGGQMAPSHLLAGGSALPPLRTPSAPSESDAVSGRVVYRERSSPGVTHIPAGAGSSSSAAPAVLRQAAGGGRQADRSYRPRGAMPYVEASVVYASAPQGRTHFPAGSDYVSEASHVPARRNIYRSIDCTACAIVSLAAVIMGVALAILGAIATAPLFLGLGTLFSLIGGIVLCSKACHRVT